MKLSIIIPALNEAASIRRAIESAWAAGADEVIVVDGGSSDATCVIAEKIECTLLHSKPGRGVQQNLGADAASGDLLLFLHADNRLEKGAGKRAIEACKSGVTCGGFEQQIDAPGYLFRWVEWGNAQRVRWFGMAYGDQAIFIRRDAFFKVGGFPEVALMEDVILMQNIRRRNWPELLPGPVHVSARRWRKHGVVMQTLRNWLLVWAHTIGVPPDRLAKYYADHVK